MICCVNTPLSRQKVPENSEILKAL